MSTSANKKPRHNIFLSAAILLCIVGFAGLILGTLMERQAPSPPPQAATAQAPVPEKPIDAAQSYFNEIQALAPDTAPVSDSPVVRQGEKTYAASLPSTGLIQETLPIEIIISNDGVAQTSLDTRTTALIQPGMRVYLYTHLNQPMNETGTVDTIEGTLLTLSVPEGYAGIYKGRTVPGKLLLYENYSAARLPASALINPHQETAFLWAAEPAGQGLYKVKKIAADGLRLVESHIEVSPDINMPVILDPDANLEEGLVIAISLSEFPLPAPDPVRQAQYDHAQRQTALLISRIERTPGDVGTEGASSCGPPPENMDLYGPSLPMNCSACGTEAKT